MFLFPFLAWLAPAVSVALLVLLWKFTDVRAVSLASLVGAFLVAAYAQWVPASGIVNAVGLVLQTLLAIYLIVRLRLGH